MNNLKNKNFKKLMNSKLLYTLPLAGIGVFCTQQTSNAMYKKPPTTTQPSSTTRNTLTTTTATTSTSITTSGSRLSTGALGSQSNLGGRGTSPTPASQSSVYYRLYLEDTHKSNQTGTQTISSSGARPSSPTPSTSTPKTYSSSLSITLGSGSKASTSSASSSSTSTPSTSSTGPSKPDDIPQMELPVTFLSYTLTKPESDIKVSLASTFGKSMKNIFGKTVSNTNFSEGNETTSQNFNSLLIDLKKNVTEKSKDFFREEAVGQFVNKGIRVNDKDIEKASNDFGESMALMVSNEAKDLKHNMSSMKDLSSNSESKINRRLLENARSNIEESSSKNLEEAVTKFVNSLR